jgi:ferric-dicitrate binding protein FerR (iron transport regulator)
MIFKRYSCYKPYFNGMDKKKILRYIEGRATDLEKKQVRAWVNSSLQNRKYFNNLFNMSALGANMPELAPNYNSLKTKIQPSRNWLKNLQKIAAILVLPLMLTVVMLVILGKPETQKIVDSPLEMSTFSGVKGKVALPDGSIVWLNSNSTLKYPHNFTGKTREVFLSGEAYFEVKKNPERPMIVSTKSAIKVKVYGTKFNLTSYDDDKDVTAALIEGSISISNPNATEKEKKIVHMKPNEVVVISKKNKAFTYDKNRKVEDCKAWKEGTLIFDDASMAEVKKAIERWHGIQIQIADSSLYKYHFTAKFNSESVVQIMELLQQTSPISYEFKDNQKVIIAKK